MVIGARREILTIARWCREKPSAAKSFKVWAIQPVELQEVPLWRASHASQITTATVNWKTCEDVSVWIKTVVEVKKVHRLWIPRVVGEECSQDVLIRHLDVGGNVVAAEQLPIVISAAIGTDPADHRIISNGGCRKGGRAGREGDYSCIPGTHGDSPPSAARVGSTGGTGSEQRYGDRIISLEPEDQSRTGSPSSSQRLSRAAVKDSRTGAKPRQQAREKAMPRLCCSRASPWRLHRSLDKQNRTC